MRHRAVEHMAKTADTEAMLALSEIDDGGLGVSAGVARVVITSLPNGYTGSGTGTLTGTANAALGTQDGVTTLAVGDVVFLPAGLANTTAAHDEGPYIILALGSGTTPYQLTRPSWFATGELIQLAQTVKIGSEGAQWRGTTWKSFSVKGAVIDTQDPGFYPDLVTQSVTLTAGTVTIAGIPVRPTNTSLAIVFASRTTPSTPSLTVQYNPSAITPGRVGTAGGLTQASVTVQAQIAAGTINVADGSTLTAAIQNW
jgi:hypothetical protein